MTEGHEQRRGDRQMRLTWERILLHYTAAHPATFPPTAPLESRGVEDCDECTLLFTKLREAVKHE